VVVDSGDAMERRLCERWWCDDAVKVFGGDEEDEDEDVNEVEEARDAAVEAESEGSHSTESA
jgi:hypothetical protein